MVNFNDVLAFILFILVGYFTGRVIEWGIKNIIKDWKNLSKIKNEQNKK